MSSVDSRLSIEQLLARAKTQLPESDSPLLDVQVLLCFVLGVSRQYLYTWPEKTLTDEALVQFETLLARRTAGEPVAYLVGQQEFWSLPLAVSPATLIPRPETELLVELVLELVNKPVAKGIDLGTGTGAIALALASEQPGWQLHGVDLQAEAVSLARQNATTLGITNVEFYQGSWFSTLDPQTGDQFDFVVSNPPYIDAADPHLVQGDVRFEPHSALVSPQQGLLDIQLITEQAREFLAPKGLLLLEHGYQQGEAVRNILMTAGYQNVRTLTDLAGQPRVTLGRFDKN